MSGISSFCDNPCNTNVSTCREQLRRFGGRGGGDRVSGKSVSSLSSPADRCQQDDCFRALQDETVLHPLNAFALDALSKCLHLITINFPLLYGCGFIFYNWHYASSWKPNWRFTLKMYLDVCDWFIASRTSSQ